MNQQSTGSNDFLFEVRDGVGRATFNRPQARNAFTFEMYERLAQICEQADKDGSIKVLVFQGAGDKAFASGTDINQFRAFKNGPASKACRRFRSGAASALAGELKVSAGHWTATMQFGSHDASAVPVRASLSTPRSSGIAFMPFSSVGKSPRLSHLMWRYSKSKS
jgi:hypothetical protein